MLVNFDDAVDFGNEPKRGKKAYGPSENEENKGQEKCVTKVKDRGSRAFDGQLGKKIMDAIKEKINSSKTRSEKSSPPPVVIFGAKMEICEEDSGL